MPLQVGVLAALLTSLCHSAGPVFFTLAGRELGSVVVNRLRLLAAALVLLLVHAIAYGTVLPHTDSGTWGWLVASGIAGLVLGDASLFQAFVVIGPRLTMLVYTLYPVMAALMARIFLGEALRPAQLAGMAVTLGGVLWVVAERPNGASALHRRRLLGLMLAFGGALGQALGMVLARQGLRSDLSSFSALAIRMSSAATVIWVFTLLKGRAGATVRMAREKPRGLRFALAGAAVGPLLGVWLSLVAIRRAEIGVATTLMALPPVFLLPIGRLVFKERFGWRAVLGTLVALAGVAMLVRA
jgi:drug/metabolite transporter (DMT)-like permease